MTYTFFDFLQLIGSLGIFIFGMKIFSDGLQKVAGSKLRSILKGMTKNRLSGIVTGFGATTVTQSSTTTTVMVVSFVNAGLITFIESTGVIMGANIGTTVTAWMVSIFGFQMQITPVAVSLIGIFFPFLFFGREKLKNLAEAMIGFGILFIGLEFIKDAVPNIQDNPEMFAALDSFTGFGFASMLLFVLVGTLLTLLTQSSSAATAITLVMLFQGWINFPIAAAMILGENIGTTVTANIAAIIGNVHAKRAARFHLIFNVIGVVWMLLLINPFLNGIDYIMQQFTDVGSMFDATEEARAAATLGISLFHTTFNVLNVILLFAFVPAIIRFVERIQKDKDKEGQAFRLQYISGGLMSSSELSIAQAFKEIELFAKLIEKMHYSFSGLFFKKQKKQEKFLKKIEKREQITDNIELEISEYLTRISSSNLSSEANRRIRSMHSMVNDLERIGDLYYQMSKTFEDMMDLDVALPKEAVVEVSEYLDVILKAIKLMRKNMADLNGQGISLDKAIKMENQINATRDKMKNAHYLRLEEGVYTPQAGVIFLDYITRLEKIGDHIFNVQEALAGRKLKTHSEMLVGR
ncbi:MAG: Na/Pi cotransporter family protein [Balneolaceae bacterium]|nr:Na/Pi cotransporter family protein [Balneolaceae bacterium]